MNNQVNEYIVGRTLTALYELYYDSKRVCWGRLKTTKTIEILYEIKYTVWWKYTLVLLKEARALLNDCNAFSIDCRTWNDFEVDS